MRIGIDAYSLKNRAGIGRYTRELVRALAEADGQHVVLFHPQGEPWQSAVDAPVVRVTSASRSRLAWELGSRRRLLDGQVLDVFHGPDFCLPRRPPAPAVVTLHDVAFLERPELLAPRARLLYTALARGALRRARRVVCHSSHAAERVAAHFALPPERVRVVPCGVSASFCAGDAAAAAAELPATCRALLRGRRHVLGVGTLEARKNFVALAQAVARARAAGEDVALVLAGAEGAGAAPIRAALLAALGADNLWICAPDDELLLRLYRSAAAVGVVSHYEGFGLPALEALACGAPLFVADHGPLVESAGGAAVVAAASDPASLAQALLAVLRAPEAERAARRQLGLRRAAALRWREVARRLLEVYAEAAGSGSGSAAARKPRPSPT